MNTVDGYGTGRGDLLPPVVCLASDLPSPLAFDLLSRPSRQGSESGCADRLTTQYGNRSVERSGAGLRSVLGLMRPLREVSANTSCVLSWWDRVPWPLLRVAYVGSSVFWCPHLCAQCVEPGGEQRESPITSGCPLLCPRRSRV